MLKEIVHFLKVWLKGGEAKLEFEIEITWVDAIFILAFIGLFIYAIVSWLS